MNHYQCSLLIVVLSTLSAVIHSPASAQEVGPRGRLLFLGVAYDEAPPQGQTVDHYNYAPDNFARLFAAQSKGLSLEKPLSKVNDSHAAVVYQGKWYGATILERLEGQAKVRYLGWDSTNTRGTYAFSDETVNLDRIDLPGGRLPIEVESAGVWYPAIITGRQAPNFKIHYIGYPDTDDEVVPLNRIRYPFVDMPAAIKAQRKK